MYRIGFTKNKHVKKPKSEKFGFLGARYPDLVRFASNKFQINEKKVRLFIAKGNQVGLELTDDISPGDLSKILHHDIVLAVSKGEEYQGPGAENGKQFDLLKKVGYAPRYPYPDNGDDLHSQRTRNFTSTREQSKEQSKEVKDEIYFPASTQTSETFHGIFPVFDGDLSPSLREIKFKESNVKEFLVETDKGYYLVFDYDQEPEYPPVKTWLDSLERECRGLVIDPRTGHILARRFHKFFNINQKEEARFDKLDWSQPRIRIQEKVDGSLVSPIPLKKGIIWATRRQRIRDVEEFVQKNSSYSSFVEKVIGKKLTPLFEWCDPLKTVGVIKHEKERLVLLAIRDNLSGEYLDLKNLEFDIPEEVEIVNELEWEGISSFNKKSKSLTWKEGYVIIFPDDSRYKLKSSWYLNMSYAAKEGGSKDFLYEILKLRKSLKDIPADRVWYIAIKNPDDLNAELVSIIKDPSEATNFLKFVQLVQSSIKVLIRDLKKWVQDSLKYEHRKQNIISVGEASGWSYEIMNALVNAEDPTLEVKNYLSKMAKRHQLDRLNGILGLTWNPFLVKPGNQNFPLTHLGKYEPCPRKVQTHILEQYLPKKISNFLGMSLNELNDQTKILIPSDYAPDEGKLKGYYEQFFKDGIDDLRIDLQPGLKSEVTLHNGNLEHALLLVQTGKLPSATEGMLGGVLVPTNYEITLGELKEAFQESFDSQYLIQISRKIKQEYKHKLYCDLDGVLVDFVRGVKELTGYTPENTPRGKMWQKILNNPGFFQHLKWMPNAKEMWEEILTIAPESPTILTGLPISCKKQVHKDKHKWCSRELGVEYEVITCMSDQKCYHSRQGHILIDDRIKAKKKWEASGGTFIHHVTPERTLYELKRVYGQLEKTPYKSSDPSLNSFYDSDVEIEWLESLDQIKELEKEPLLGLDAEWNFKNPNEPLSIIQIATPRKAYLLDMLSSSSVPEPVKEAFYQILQNPLILKLGFDVIGDVVRVPTDIVNLLDLQELAIDTLECDWDKGELPSLDNLVQVLLKVKLNKSKDLQSGEWDQRPLTQSQIKYAALDSLALLDLYQKMPFKAPGKTYYTARLTGNPGFEKDQFDPSEIVKVIYLGVFLSPGSKRELSKRFPYKHSKVWGDHITLKYHPSERELRGSPVGVKKEFKVIAFHEDEQIQAVQVQDENGKQYHITLSVAPNVTAKESNDIVDWTLLEDEQIFTVSGICGLLVSYMNDQTSLLSSLPKKLQTQIMRFQENAQPGQHLKLSSLSPAERAAVHEYASQTGMKSSSKGQKEKRIITLTFTRQKKDLEQASGDTIIKHASLPEKKKKEKERKMIWRITDPYIFSILRIHTRLYDDPDAFELNSNGFENPQKVLGLLKEKTLLILRGLPGSGKSSLLDYLPVDRICSADSFFEQDGFYYFDQTQLHQAHKVCYQNVDEGMSLGLPIIAIDNTNSKLSEYQKYLDLAYGNGYHPVILEILTADKDMALQFAARTKHRVPGKDVLRMLSRWEMDSNAQLIKPYFPKKEDVQHDYSQTKSLQRWLTRNHFFHFQKDRHATHLSMEVGNRPATFLDIPRKIHDEFLKRFVETEGEPKYLLEIPDHEFKAFLDVDYLADLPLSEDEIEELVQLTQKVFQTEIWVTGICAVQDNGKTKSGMHFKCPKLIVGKEEMLELRDQLIQLLEKEKPGINWEHVIDPNVYSSKRGIRILGSRKVTKGRDKGRAHDFMMALDQNGKRIEDTPTGADLLKKLSIFSWVEV